MTQSGRQGADAGVGTDGATHSRGRSLGGVKRDEGEGVARIHTEMRRNSLPPPEIAVEHGIFIIRLFNANPDDELAAEPRSRAPSRAFRPYSGGDES